MPFIPRSLVLVLSVLSILPSALAIGDFPCSGSSNSQSCLLWSTDPGAQGKINPNASCTPDPINPTMSYCGYAKSACNVQTDCDYGTCQGGFCSGYLGDACPNGANDCQAFFFCGPDKKCGGAGAACANGDLVSPIPHPEQQCVSNVCDTTAKLCGAPPPAGMPIGSGCGNPSVCASGTCTNSLCAAAAPVPSAAKKTKRYVLNGSGPNVNSCPQGQTACSVGEGPLAGFECIDSQVNLERCGGCITDGLGEDCTAISGVESVMCDVGKCLVLSCGSGLDISVNGASCVPAYRF